MNTDFWRGKRVFMTGHTGFKGSWACILLNSMGAKVWGYALEPPTEPSLFALARVDRLVESTLGDVRDLGALASVMSRAAPDVVLHMAAQSVVLKSYEEPIDTFSTNVLGTAQTLEAVRRMAKPCTVVNVTTDKCYENMGWVWGYRESDQLGGHDPYSASKACAELVGQSYAASYFPPTRCSQHGVGLASARAGNVIGGGDWTPRQLIPDTIAALAQRRPVILRHPDAVRPWQHVLDCLAGYLALAERLAGDPVAYSGAWNFGPPLEDARPVSHVVEALATHWNQTPAWVADSVQHAPEERQLRLDVSKAATELEWRCRLPLDTALSWVANWYQGLQRGESALELCQAQIRAFLDLDSGSRPGSGAE